MTADSKPTLDPQAPRSPAPDAGRPPVGPRRKSERTRLRLVDAVRAEIESSGVFTAEQVARRAETSPATFYNHFASKDEALAASFASVMDDLVDHVEAHLRIDRLLEAGLEGFARDWVSACVAFFRTNSACLRAAQAQLPQSAELRAIYRDHEAAALAHYTRFVELGQRAGVVRPGPASAIALAWMIQDEGWNHPLVLRLTPGDALHAELARGVVRHLRAEHDADGSGMA